MTSRSASGGGRSPGITPGARWQGGCSQPSSTRDDDHGAARMTPQTPSDEMKGTASMRDRLQSVAARLWHSQTVENTFWVGAASALSALLGAVTSGLYARTLGVEEYGVLMLIISLVTMLVALSDLGIGGSIVRFGTEKIARDDVAGFRAVLN